MKNVKKFIRYSIVFFFVLAPISGLFAAESLYFPVDTQQYELGPEDVIELWMPLSPDQVAGIALPYQAFGNEIYSINTLKIDPYGNITVPLIGAVRAIGLTAEELANRLEGRLSTYIVNPQVTIQVTDYANFRIRNRVCVIGEVAFPGVHAIPVGDTITTVEAVSLAGGYIKGAYLSNVIVAKKDPEEGALFKKVDFNKALKGDPEHNITLKPGDVVYVPKSFIAHVGTFVEFFFSNTDPVLDYYLKAYDVRNLMRKWH